MDKIIIVKERIPSTDPRLKRNVYHDSRSRNFAFDTRGRSLASVTHPRHISILNQGNVGSCTGNAGVGALATDPLFNTLPKVSKYPLNQIGALALYSDAEIIDGSGQYPPNDFGSTGLSIAKALQSASIISGYQHTFTLNDALLALTQYPILVGINWYNGMTFPDRDGRVKITGSLAGGHEIVARQIDVPNSRVWFDNSWGTSWGLSGRFYLTFTDLGTLLSQQGDVIVLLPNTVPAPAPVPAPNLASSADITLAAAMRAWLTAKGL